MPMLMDKSRQDSFVPKLLTSLGFVFMSLFAILLISCDYVSKSYSSNKRFSETSLGDSHLTTNLDSISHYVRRLLFLEKHACDSTVLLDPITSMYSNGQMDSSMAKTNSIDNTLPTLDKLMVDAVSQVLSNSAMIDRYHAMGDVGKDSINLARYNYLRAVERTYGDSISTDSSDYLFKNYVSHMSLLYSCLPLSRESPYYHYLERYSTLVDQMPESLSLLKKMFWLLESSVAIHAKDRDRTIAAAENQIQTILEEEGTKSLVRFGQQSLSQKNVYLYLMAFRQLFWADKLPDSIAIRNMNYIRTLGGQLGKKIAYPKLAASSLSDSLLFAFIAGKNKQVVDIAERMFETGDTLVIDPYYIIRTESRALHRYPKLSSNARIGLRNTHELNIAFLNQLKRGQDDYYMLSSLQSEFRKSAQLKLRGQQANTRILYVLSGVSFLAFILLTLTLIRSQISKRKIAEARAEADRLRAVAERTQNLQNHFMHNMNHEIRTPINAIVGFSDLLVEDDSLTKSERKDFGDTIKNNGDMLIQIINDVLDIARLESGQYELSYEKVSLNTLCKQVLDTIRHRLPEGVELRFDTAFGDDYLYCTDIHRLEQILLNYLSNACKHTKEGYILLSVEPLDDKVEFSVSNTGKSIPPEKVKKLFKRFRKLNNEAQGTGLGLSICLKLATLMGGNVYYDTTFIDGARFVCELPLIVNEKC